MLLEFNADPNKPDAVFKYLFIFNNLFHTRNQIRLCTSQQTKVIEDLYSCLLKMEPILILQIPRYLSICKNCLLKFREDHLFI